MARCVALLGMIATHVLERRTPDGSLTLVQSLAGGRASALFAVLAGLSIALVTGRSEPVRGRARAAASVSLVVRALLVAAVGLALGDLDSGIAVILTYYGVLFLLAVPFLGLGVRALALLAAGWVVVVPVVSHLVRPSLPERGFTNPTPTQLVEQPWHLVSELLLTGYYPAVPWLAYLFAGMALGRLDLTRRRTAFGLAWVGTAVVLVATGASGLLLRRADVVVPLARDYQLDTPTPEALRLSIEGGMFGTTPTGGSWQWLLVAAPHSGTPFDLAQTIGSALLVVGVLLLVVGAVRAPVWTRTWALLFGAGAMTLTLYSLHVVMRTQDVLPEDLRTSYRFHVLVVLALGLAFAALRRRGPLEAVVRWVSTAAGRLVPRPGGRP